MELSNAFNVKDFGAKGDGKTDDTKAFQAALDKAGITGGTVYVPIARYRFDGSMTVPEGVALKGSWEGHHYPSVDKGSTLLVYGGRDQEDAPPFIIMKKGSTVRGLTIWYPEQKFPDIHPYPWVISIRGSRCNILDISIPNPYNGLDLGVHTNDSVTVRNINMSPLRRGVYIDNCYDVQRIENVHCVHMDWESLGPESGMDYQSYRKYALANLEGFIIGKCDWNIMINCFVLNAKCGFRFIEMVYDPKKDLGEKCSECVIIPEVGLGQAPSGNIMILNSGADNGPLSVKIESVQEHAGITFTNCQFMNSIEIDETNTGPVKLTSCGFWGQCRSGSVVLNKGKGEVFLSSCHFSAWEDQNNPYVWDPKHPFIRIENGKLFMTGCLFKDYGNTPDAHIYLGEKVESAAIIGVSVQGGTLAVKNRTKGDVQIVGKSIQK